MRDVKFLSAMVDVSRNSVLKKEEIKNLLNECKALKIPMFIFSNGKYLRI